MTIRVIVCLGKVKDMDIKTYGFSVVRDRADKGLLKIDIIWI